MNKENLDKNSFENKDSFEKFLLSEYSHIAQAHFKSLETISTFFRYYILILSIPISAIGIFYQISPEKEVGISNFITNYRWEISMSFVLIAIVGIGMFFYILNLRFDGLLYARVVNGIRKYFYGKSSEDMNYKLHIRVLPQSPQIPNYHEPRYFFPIIFVFGIINSIYFDLAFFVFSKQVPWIRWSLFLIPIVIVFLHFRFYYLYARYRDRSYLRSNIIGIDIDGVLNKHRKHFCFLLKEKTGKDINPEKINVIPVHEGKLGITREEERAVFNDPEYWVNMPVMEGAEKNIRKIHNVLRLKVWIFTYRPWPDNPDKKSNYNSIKKFLDNCKVFSSSLLILRILINLPNIPFTKRFSFRLKEKPLEAITIKWLKDNGIIYDEFFLEKGNDFSSDPGGNFKNRFYIARKKQIKFFVEDDLEKAKKLSYICDLVFLFSQPYNKSNKSLNKEINDKRVKLPDNIIRVENWDDIYKFIRSVS